MNRIAIALFLLAGGASYAQPPGNPNDPRSRSAAGAQIQAGQVIAEVRVVDNQARRLPGPPQAEIRRQCDICIAKAARLQQSIAAFQPYPAIIAQFQDLDREVDQLVAKTRAFAANDALILTAAGRADFACARLGTALNFGNGGPLVPPIPPGGGLNDPQRESLRRLARSLDSQAEALLAVARQTLPPDRFGRQLESDIRQFARSADRIVDLLNGPARIEQIQAEFPPVQVRWVALAQSLGGVGIAPYPQLRLQAAQVDQSYRILAAALGMPVGGGPVIPPGPGIPPPVVDPGFPISNHRDQGIIALGAGEGGVPVVRLLLDRRGQTQQDFMAYDASFQGGVRVAVGDVNGDGIVDIITAPGPGAPPLVRIFNGRDFSLINQFHAYDPLMLSGVWVAVGDFSGTGRADVVTGAGDGGGPHVRVFDGMTLQVKAEFFAYDQRMSCGARVAVADVDGDRIPDVITAPGPGGEPLVKVFSGRNAQPIAGFYAYEQAFLGGVFVAAADVTGNGRAEIVTGPGANGGPHVRMFDPMTGAALGEVWPYDRNFLGGVRVALFDADRTRQPSLLVAPGPGMSPVVRIIGARNGQVVSEFSAFDPNFRGGAWVAGN